MDKDILQLIYYSNAFIFMKALSVILGVTLLWSKISISIKSKIICAYYGIVLGGMIGYMVADNRLGLCLGTMIGCAVLMILNEIPVQRHLLVPSFVFYFQIVYIVAKTVIELSHLNVYEVMGMYPDLLVDYMAINVTMIFAAVVSIIVTAIMSQKELNGIHINFYCFIEGIVLIIGALLSGTDTLFYMSGEWQDFFAPLLNIEYGEREIVALLILAGTMIAWGWIKATSNKMVKREKWICQVDSGIPKDCYEVVEFVSNTEATYVILEGSKYKIKINLYFVDSVMLSDEGRRIRTYNEIEEIQKYRKDFYGIPFYKVINSSYAAWLTEEAAGFYDEFEHYVIITMNDIIDILTYETPNIEVESL